MWFCFDLLLNHGDDHIHFPQEVKKKCKYGKYFYLLQIFTILTTQKPNMF